MAKFDDLPANAFIRERQLLDIVPASRSLVWRWVKENRFPAPERIGGGRLVGWRVGAVRSWLANSPAA